MKSFTLILLSILFIQTLSGQGGNKSKVTVLNLEESFSRQQDVPLSRFVDKITYIPLENNPQAMLGGLVYYEVTDEYVIVRQTRYDRTNQILLFDRNTGKFMREIGKNGRGPGEYYNYQFIPFDPVKKEFYAQGLSREILVYDISGRNIDVIKMPKIENKYGEVISLSTKPINFDNMLDDNVFVGYISNSFGIEQIKLVLLTKEGVLKIFPNYQALNAKIDGVLLVSRNSNNHTFYKWNNKLYLLEVYCDTLYEVTKNSLVPRFYFDFGKYNVTWSMRADANDFRGITFKDYFYIRDIDENKNYIIIEILYEGKDYTGFIEKKTNSVTLCKKSISGFSGFKDDISGLMDVRPLGITQKNEMVYVINPLYLMKFLKENPEKAELARTRFPWLKNIDEFSNPIIAIGKCRE